MKEVTQYQCEICKHLYRTKEEAEKCERSHVTPVSVALPLNFKRPVDESYGYPHIVIVTMDNGDTAEYIYSRQIN